jgi:hypothetical protein
MGFKVVMALTNVRPSKEEETVASIKALSTHGQIRISNPAAQKLEIGEGDKFYAVVAETEKGLQVFVAKSLKEGLGHAVGGKNSYFTTSGAVVWSKMREAAFAGQEVSENDIVTYGFTGETVEDEGMVFHAIAVTGITQKQIRVKSEKAPTVFEAEPTTEDAEVEVDLEEAEEA